MTEPKFDTAAFIEFCRSKPVGECFDPLNPRRCALGQFGFGEVAAGVFEAEQNGIPRDVWRAAICDEPSTFGALANRLAKALNTISGEMHR